MLQIMTRDKHLSKITNAVNEKSFTEIIEKIKTYKRIFLFI